jgi:methyltransferase (TIGR00027 family)
VDERSASRTALVTALMRSRHTRLDPKPLIDDPRGDRLVPETVRGALRDIAFSEMDAQARERALAAPERIVDDYLRSVSAYANVVLRSRFAEDALAAAVSSGVRQYVIVGAGFDSFALRPRPFAQDVAVYELDHPATQGLKLQRLAACGVTLPTSTFYIGADLGQQDLASALSRTPFRSDQLTFFSWLGVTMYLTREANRALLRAMAKCGAPGSELVFTYLDESVLAANVRSEGSRSLRKAVASVREPFVSGFDPSLLGMELGQAGFELVEDLTGPRLVQRYDGDGANGFRSAGTSHIARARVPRRAESRSQRPAGAR